MHFLHDTLKIFYSSDRIADVVVKERESEIAVYFDLIPRFNKSGEKSFERSEYYVKTHFSVLSNAQ